MSCVAMLPQDEDSLRHEVLMHRAKDLGIAQVALLIRGQDWRAIEADRF